jgi:catechol 2,3-dioxygenase-like lactoylglutathione lyase family enzyme
MDDIGHLHHVGHVVRDIGAAVALYRRMGFRLPGATFPALAPAPGEPARAFGAGNTHVTFGRNFVELVTVADTAPDGSTLVPLEAPPAALERLTAGIAATAARLSAALARFEGMHILVFQTPDADAAAARLAADGVPHGGVQRLHRPGPSGGAPVPIGFVELDPEAPEGRLALAEDLAGGERPEHANGAVDLVESILCVPDAELAEHVHRYERYLARPAAGTGPVRSFELDGARVMLAAASGLDGVLPGERTPVSPAFAGYVVAVRRLDAAGHLLADAGFPLRETPAGELLVPAAAALGTAVVFRQAA